MARFRCRNSRSGGPLVGLDLEPLARVPRHAPHDELEAGDAGNGDPGDGVLDLGRRQIRPKVHLGVLHLASCERPRPVLGHPGMLHDLAHREPLLRVLRDHAAQQILELRLVARKVELRLVVLGAGRRTRKFETVEEDEPLGLDTALGEKREAVVDHPEKQHTEGPYICGAPGVLRGRMLPLLPRRANAQNLRALVRDGPRVGAQCILALVAVGVAQSEVAELGTGAVERKQAVFSLDLCSGRARERGSGRRGRNE